MSSITLSVAELAAVVLAAVALATTDASAVSRLAVAFIAKKLGIKPAEITRYQSATEDDSE